MLRPCPRQTLRRPIKTSRLLANPGFTKRPSNANKHPHRDFTQVVAEDVKPDILYALLVSFLACFAVGIDFFLKYDYQRRRSRYSNQ